MKFVADFHLHSKYSRATSSEMVLPKMAEAAQIKGVKVLGTGDFTHPQWFSHLKESLEPAEPGLFKLKDETAFGGETRFILTSEISCIYTKKGKVRKIHLLIFAPDFATVEKINVRLSFVGNLRSDGRPILGLDAKELAKIILGIQADCLVVPAHIWTPWFSLFGSKSGFDTIEECFEDYSGYIYAGETGLSSDPAMNWRLSLLDKIALISNSDAHSPAKIGREANVFNVPLGYSGIVEAVKKRDPAKFLYTIEFFPEEGKYHYDGHRLCQVRLSPSETKRCGGLCPVCGRPLTIGVMSRVEELADRPADFQPEGALPFKKLVPLDEIIAAALGVGVGTKEVKKEYDRLVKNLGTEFNVLLEAPLPQIESFTLPEIAEAIWRVREGKVEVSPGYDGVYGEIKIFSKEEKEKGLSQKTLF